MGKKGLLRMCLLQVRLVSGQLAEICRGDLQVSMWVLLLHVVGYQGCTVLSVKHIAQIDLYKYKHIYLYIYVNACTYVYVYIYIYMYVKYIIYICVCVCILSPSSDAPLKHCTRSRTLCRPRCLEAWLHFLIAWHCLFAWCLRSTGIISQTKGAVWHSILNK